MTSLNKREWITLSGLLILSLVPCVTGIIRLFEIAGEMQILPHNPRVDEVPEPAVLHIAASVVYCMLGAFQFLPSIRNAYPKWHRRCGRVLIFAAVVSAVSGLWMTHFYAFPVELQGSLLYGVRMVVGVAMLASIILAFFAIKNRQFTHHRAFMIRAYALGLGAGTQVVVITPWLVTIGEPEELTRDILMTSAWVINVLVAEFVIRKFQRYAI